MGEREEPEVRRYCVLQSRIVTTELKRHELAERSRVASPGVESQRGDAQCSLQFAVRHRRRLAFDTTNVSGAIAARFVRAFAVSSAACRRRLSALVALWHARSDRRMVVSRVRYRT